MQGQWIGSYPDGSGEGHVRLNLDQVGGRYSGIAINSPADPRLPTLWTAIKTTGTDGSFDFPDLRVDAVDPFSGVAASAEQKQKFYPAYNFPIIAALKAELKGDLIELRYRPLGGPETSVELMKSKASEPSTLAPVKDVNTWSAFKIYVNTICNDHRYLFRGQQTLRRLRTTFHRSGRADLWRYLQEDVPNIHRLLSAQTKHLFHLNIPDENGAFISLLQHHGYPTPLLDWTLSPYVAAFFAYRRISKVNANTSKEHVRIFIFDEEAWSVDLQQYMRAEDRRPHLSKLQFLAIENQRMIPQQSISTVANIDDIEAYIQGIEGYKNKKYLQVVDLPGNEREAVMKELRYMGITAGSMFPGIDGVCEELREISF